MRAEVSWGWAALLVALGAACKGGVQAEPRIAAATADDDRRWEIQEGPSPAPTASHAPAPGVAAPAASVAAPPTATAPSFVGVTHDLSLAPSAPRDAACRCLAVAVGPLSDARFAWVMERPANAPGSLALALAVAADGVACDASAFDPARASIAGVEREGADVVVTVENVEAGRPIMRGALIAPLAPGGAIIVRSRGGAPYGAPAAGGPGPCRIAIPP